MVSQRCSSKMDWCDFSCKPNGSVAIESERQGTRNDYVYDLYPKYNVLSVRETVQAAQRLTNLLLEAPFGIFIVSAHFLELLPCRRGISSKYDRFSKLEVGASYSDKWRLREFLGSIGCDFINDETKYNCGEPLEASQPAIEGDVFFTSSASKLNHFFLHWRDASVSDLIHSAKHLMTLLPRGEDDPIIAVQTTLDVLKYSFGMWHSYLEIATGHDETKVLEVLRQAYGDRLKYYQDIDESTLREPWAGLKGFWVREFA